MHFDFNADEGTGNLSLRAYFAAIIGPRRIVHGRRTVKRAPLNNVISLLGASAEGIEVMYFEVWLPQSSIQSLPGNGAYIAFSSSESAGQDAFQILLSATQRFSGVLLAGDQIYAQSVRDANGNPLVNEVPLIVSSVVF